MYRGLLVLLLWLNLAVLKLLTNPPSTAGARSRDASSNQRAIDPPSRRNWSSSCSLYNSILQYIWGVFHSV